MHKKTAVILFNLGEPDRLDAVKPFLFNLFYDPAILTVPNPMRWMMAKSISKQRAPRARNNFRVMENKLSILDETEKQRLKLETVLNDKSDDEFKCFMFMRHWTPFAKDIINNIKAFSPDEIVLLPLYPQYSVTTTGSGLIEWNKQAKLAKLEIPFRVVKAYPDHDFFVDTIADMIKEKLKSLKSKDYRLLLSAHSLPKKTIEVGDSYQIQVEKTCTTLIKKLGDDQLDHIICYQSRVRPLEEIGPSTEIEIERAARDKKNIILVPITFVSENSETFVELDIEYKDVAEKAGIKDYIRINTVQDKDAFIIGLADLVKDNRV